MYPPSVLLMMLLLLLLLMMMMTAHGRTERNSVHWQLDHKTPGLDRKSRTLYIGGIFPMSGAWAGGMGCRPAVDIALEDINNRKDLLPNFKLKMLANDSECKPGLGMKVLYDLVYNDPVKLMILGPGCSVVSTYVGQAARMWNLVTLSYGSSSPALSERKRFPLFFRTHPSATLHNPARIKLFQKFGWTRISTIQETQEVFTSTMDDLEEQANKVGIQVVVRTNFINKPANAVANLKRQDARVIVGLFYENKARSVFCEAYKEKLYGPKYVWFIIGWYADNWYMQPDTNCTVEQMQEVLEGHFTTEGVMLTQEHRASVSGMTAGSSMSRVKRKIKEIYGREVNPLSVTGYVEAPLAYDAVWALALALNRTQHRLERRGKSLEEFNYSNDEISNEIFKAMNTTNFVGASGYVAFNEKGDRIALTQIEQMWDGNYTTIGFYDSTTDNLTWSNKERWLGGKKPADRTTVEPVLRVVSLSLYICLGFVALLGILASFLLLAFVWINRHTCVIKLSQPQMNSAMLVGCIVCFSCIFLNGVDGKFVDKNSLSYFCHLRAWLLCIGFTLGYGSMFSKVWTLYRLKTGSRKDSQVVSEHEMYLVLSVFFALDVIIMASWSLINPFYPDLEFFPLEQPDVIERDIEFLPQLEHCRSQNLFVWYGVVFGYKGVLLLFGILLVYETRSIKLHQINDSRLVSMSICNIVVLCVITMPVALIIESHQDATFIFVSVSILLCNFLSMALVFIPKMRDIWNGVHHEETDGACALTDDDKLKLEVEQCQQLQQENDFLRQQLAEKEERLLELKNRLQTKLAAEPVFQHKSSILK